METPATLILAEVQRLQGEDQEGAAEDLLRSAIVERPTERSLLHAYAFMAVRREQWGEAVRRWMIAKSVYPTDEVAGWELFRAKSLAIEYGVAVAEAERVTAGGATESLGDLMMRFESLGGHFVGCEFGGIQRAYGAEPLGLLRWSEMTPESLVSSLMARFDGVGLIENTDLFVEFNDHYDEYRTRDKRFGMVMHTFVRADSLPFDAMMARTCRRLQYLARKLCGGPFRGRKDFCLQDHGSESCQFGAGGDPRGHEGLRKQHAAIRAPCRRG